MGDRHKNFIASVLEGSADRQLVASRIQWRYAQCQASLCDAFLERAISSKILDKL